MSLAGMSLMLAGLALPVSAIETIDLRSATNFAVLAGSTVTNSGSAGTIVIGDLGVAPGTSVTGFPPGSVIGQIHAGGPIADQAQMDVTTAYGDAFDRQTPALVAGNLGGQTLAPGLYKSTSSLAISSGDLTLDGQNDPNAVFIFQIASTLTTTVGRQVILTNGAQPCRIFWQVGSSATIGVGSLMQGTIMAAESITVETGAVINGRLLARTGAVTLDSNPVNAPLPQPNDINGDCIVNVADVTALANFIEGHIDFIAGDGDVNNDGEIDHQDVDDLADLIVNAPL
jgi:hypothetical protein